jgi:hypothetical protein
MVGAHIIKPSNFSGSTYPISTNSSNNIRMRCPNYRAATANNKNSTQQLLNVSVVVHIIHNGDAVGQNENIADSRVQAQIAALNTDYQALNSNYNSTPSQFSAARGNPQISFCLATVDPDGNPTTGIVRHQMSNPTSQADIEYTIKPQTYWDSYRYMNIWVLPIPGTTATSGILGYAYLPLGLASQGGTVGSDYDGIVVDYRWFGGPGSTGYSGYKTLTHETGHYFGLSHIWSNMQGDSGCSTAQDDGIADTPNVADPTSDLDPTFNCQSGFGTGPVSCGLEHMYVNYMDYVNDEDCYTSFTNGQTAVMRAVLSGTATQFGFASRQLLVDNGNCTEPCNISASVSTQPTGCQNTGSATVTAQGGTTPYSYLWSNGATTASIANLPAGTYNVTVTDASGTCTKTASGTVTSTCQPCNISASVSAQPTGCQNTGSATVTAQGGTTPYSYLWSNGATTASIANLPAGTYNVTVTDASGTCTKTASGTVTSTCQPCNISASVSTQPTGCQNTGSATVTAQGGTTPYSYLWSNGATTASIANLPAGTYNVTVTDASGTCTKTASGTVTSTCQPCNISASVSTQPTGCQNTGSATVTAQGGTTPYSYLWSNGATTASIANLPAGTYNVTVTDASGTCTKTASGTVTSTCQPCNISASVSTQPTGCQNTGSATVTAQGGTTPYSYLWSNGATTASIASLPAGTYNVTVTDASGTCTKTASGTVTSITINFSITKTDVACFGGNNGSATIVTQGTSYAYLWSNGATTGTIGNLAAGTYSVTVSASGCVVTQTINITQPTALAVTTVPFNSSCGTGNASIQANVNGGTPPYTYLWSNGATTTTLSNLQTGSYALTVTDAHGCSVIKTTQVTNSTGAPSLSVTSTPPSCGGLSDGIVDLSVTGGTSPYTYSWTGGATTQDLLGVPAGQYTVIVTDANGCIAVISVHLVAPSSMNLILSSTPSTGNDGAAIANVSGGVPPYSYNWNTGATTQIINGLAADTYLVTVTDANGCKATGSVEVQPFTDVNTLEGLNQFSLYPNPNRGIFYATLSFSQYTEATISIYNLLGQQLATYTAQGTEWQQPFDMTQQATGTYQIVVRTPKGQAARRFVITP